MTQVPSQRPSAVPVVPEVPEGADSPPASRTALPESPARPAMQELMAKLESLTGVPIDPDGRFVEWLTGNVDGFVMALEMLLADDSRGVEFRRILLGTPNLTFVATVNAFINERPEAITALTNCHPDNTRDYWRWQGHAEARRQLAERLGQTVPHNPGDTTGPKADGDGRA